MNPATYGRHNRGSTDLMAHWLWASITRFTFGEFRGAHRSTR